MRKAFIITERRADYSRFQPILKIIQEDKDLDYDLVVTGLHVKPEHGLTINEIKSDNFKIFSTFEMFLETEDTGAAMVRAYAEAVKQVSIILEQSKPDLILSGFDIAANAAVTLAGAHMNIPVAHIQGGEVTGTIDESIRHAVTKLSHIHFPATEDAALRIIKMGEEQSKVFNVGCPYIDIIKSKKFKSKNELSKKYGFNKDKSFIIFTQHAVTTEFGSSLEQIKISINALKQFVDCQIIAFYSNTDMGGYEIIDEINKEDNFIVIPNMDSSDFLSLMNCSTVMVGNSSAAIREAPSFALPAVNIGTRQNGRLRSSNVIDVDHNIEDIKKALYKCINDNDFKMKIKKEKNPYGNGNSAKRIVNIINEIEIDKSLIQKKIAYEI